MRDDVVEIIDEGDATKILESNDDADVPEPPAARKYAAADRLLDDTPEEVRSAFESELVQIMSRPNLFFTLLRTEAGTVTGFDLSTSIYPFSDGFRFREYNRAVQSVVTIGNAAMMYARRALDVEGAVAGKSTHEPLPYIQ